ncbi:MAG: hypothetical protein HY561_13605 [Gemmatimonadetes bacterium]|nr:hypothetical protein [Gemmatimonadota bacterium]
MIRDLLWACPQCGTERGIRQNGRRETCTACGTEYRRGRGSTIEARDARGLRITLPATTWMQRLPPVRFGEGESGEGGGGESAYSERVQVRFAAGVTAVRRATELLGWAEHFGEARTGILTLTRDGLAFHADDDEVREWPLALLTAVQPSSSTLQLKPRGEPLVSLRFLEGSARYWEELLQLALRRFYRRSGLGEILEFQPRIVAR